ncbi:hypothetical protein [Chelativorans salis]|uniref:Anti-sigma factor NepR domain-containing protein n=1 Tax=Chelativorans salis TaxID=2978478 RepID=A0ABT2LSB4_9HYPH|nr:hypothetical protein [Chelativorans sp. EGI FJ00035]MCT7377421.1 hypothetical protein [Chelativorans sp. EGI FJ00035]
MQSRLSNGRPTVEQLRDDIDHGRAGDKVAYPDPAAAPLGADDEAGGHPPTADQVAEAMRCELSRYEEEEPRMPASLRLLLRETMMEPLPTRLLELARRLEKALAAHQDDR